MVRPSMRPLLLFVPLLTISSLLACSSGSGVSGSAPMSTLNPGDYAKVCKFYNDKSQALVGQTCMASQQVVMQILRIDCTTNPFTGTMCPATVSDVEACASNTDACSALPGGKRPAECVKVAQCLGGGS
jgi:hypothetical protein